MKIFFSNSFLTTLSWKKIVFISFGILILLLPGQLEFVFRAHLRQLHVQTLTNTKSQRFPGMHFSKLSRLKKLREIKVDSEQTKIYVQRSGVRKFCLSQGEMRSKLWAAERAPNKTRLVKDDKYQHEKLKKSSKNTGINSKISYEEFWLFYDRLIFPRYSLTVVHPLFSVEKSWKENVDHPFFSHFLPSSEEYVLTQHISILPPLLDIFSIPGLTNYNSLQIIEFSNRRRGRKNDKDFAIYPFIYYGTGSNKLDHYFAFFPIGGTVRSKLMMDYIHFALFPIWARYGHYRSGYEATSIFFPFFLTGKGLYKREIRIFPFYQYSEFRNHFQRWSFLWPIIFYEKNFLSSQAPQHVFFIVPLYGYKVRKMAASYTLFWPFFSWGYDSQSGAREYNIVWPFVQIQNAKDPFIYKRYFFPFYGIYKFRKKSSEYITPLYFEMVNRSSRYQTRQTFLIPMVWVSEKYGANADTGLPEKRRFTFKMWPFFHYYDDYEEGDFDFNFLSPLGVHGDGYFTRIFSPFWSILTIRSVSFHRLSNRERWVSGVDMSDEDRELYHKKFRYFSIFFRLFSHWRIGDTSHWQVPFLLSYTSKKEQGYRISILYGLFEYNSIPKQDSLESKEDSASQVSRDGKENPIDKADGANEPKETSARRRIFWFIKI